MKTTFMIYPYMESLLKKLNRRHSNPAKSSTTKINKHITSGYSFFTHCSFDATKNKHDYYKGKDATKSMRQK